jgi:cellulose synthase/poly-beta-1,6-N-acetylglucosamine synthase-like glycosyltransferase
VSVRLVDGATDAERFSLRTAIGRDLSYFLIYGALALTHILVQLTFGHVEHVLNARRLRTEPGYRGEERTVSVVVPVYNEEPALLRGCLQSIAGQDHRALEVIVVDDGSHNHAEHDSIYAEYAQLPGWTVLEQRVNRGKRMAQKVAFDRASSDVIVTIDSDTLLRTPDAIRCIQRRFADPRVGAVTGSVGVENESRNILTRLIASRYWMAFNQERAAQSLFGVTMCCSGPFSAFRGDLIRELKDEYVDQSFLGEACTFGDDRHLTNLILRAGYRVVYDDNAHAKTNVPDTLRAYLRQQVRWNKSFYREALWTARFAHRRHPYLAFDLLLQIILPFMLMTALVAVAYHAVAVDANVLWHWAAVLAGIALLRCAYGFARTRERSFLVFVLYGFVHVAVLIPVRLYALATLRRNHWGSRSGGTVAPRLPNSLRAVGPAGASPSEMARPR